MKHSESSTTDEQRRFRHTTSPKCVYNREKKPVSGPDVVSWREIHEFSDDLQSSHCAKANYTVTISSNNHSVMSASSATPSPPSSRASSLSSQGPRTPPNMHQNNIDPAAKWLVQKYGGTSVGKFAVQIAENIIPYVLLPFPYRTLPRPREYHQRILGPAENRDCVLSTFGEHQGARYYQPPPQGSGGGVEAG